MNTIMLNDYQTGPVCIVSEPPQQEYGKSPRRMGSRKWSDLEKKQTFVNLKSAFGLRKVFGEESGKADLIRLLNSLIKDPERKVKEVVFSHVETNASNEEERNAIYNIFCTDNMGRKFLMGTQDNYQDNKLQGMELWTTKPVVMNARKDAGRNLELPSHCGVLFTSFDVDNETDSDYIRYFTTCDEETMKVGINLMNFIVIELQKFTKSIEELETEQDVFLFLLKNMETLSAFPASLDFDLYGPLFERARIANLTMEESRMYDLDNLAEEKHRAELKSGFSLGRKEGMAEGISLANEQVVKSLIEHGRFTYEDIAFFTGIKFAEVLQIRDRLIRD